MVRVVGIDPGTRSMDVCGLEGGEGYYERIVDTVEAAERPEALIEAIEAAEPFAVNPSIRNLRRHPRGFS